MDQKNKQKNARQPELIWLPFAYKKKAGRHAKKIQLKSKYFYITISLRSFRTSKRGRTKSYNQIVLPLPFAVREIAITSRHKYSFMPIKIPRPLPNFLIVALFLGSLIYFALHLYGTPNISIATQPKVKAASINVSSTKTLPRSQPTELQIPKINVDTPLASVGLKSDGSLDVPADYHIAGWYSGSPTPGELGPSVIDGHVDNHEGLGVFWRLRELAPGDTFQVIRADSSVATFRVDSIDQFPQSNFPTKKVYGKINFAGIRLITCGGIFNTQTHHYSDNIVVFGSLQ